MLNFKKVILLGLFFISSQLAVSQNTKNSKEDFDERFQQQMINIQNELKLDDLQTVFVKNTLLKYHQAKMELVQSSERNDILMAQVNDLNLKQDEELLKVLSEEQVSKLKDLLKNQVIKQKKKRHSRKGRRNK